MWDRTLTIGSAGKTFSVTGWKVSPCGGRVWCHPPALWSLTVMPAMGAEKGVAGPQGPHLLPVSLVQVGWVLGPENIMKHLRTVHQNSIYHCPTQAQVRRAGTSKGRAHPAQWRAPLTNLSVPLFRLR